MLHLQLKFPVYSRLCSFTSVFDDLHAKTYHPEGCFSENKPNFKYIKIGVSSFETSKYEILSAWRGEKTNPIKANSNPIYERPKMYLNNAITMNYAISTSLTKIKNKPNSKPINTEIANNQSSIIDNQLRRQTQSQKVCPGKKLLISTCTAKDYNVKLKCLLPPEFVSRINLFISTWFFGGLKMFYFAAIAKGLTRKSTNHKAPHTRFINIILLIITICLYISPAQASSSSSDSIEPLNRFPRMVQEYFVKSVRRIEQQANKRRAALKNRDDAEAYVQDIREKIQQSFGPWPEKTPLNPRITGVVERDEYKIEKIIFESRPDFLVTANLYLPKGRKFPLPGVVGTCGHSSNGKASEPYQSFAQGLARQGYVVLIYDPIGQGERLQYPDEDLKSKIGVGVREHLYAGNQQFLVGEFFGSWRAWDGIRALDYLLTRKEVDPKHIGVTGNSGGGTMTTWLCGVESRWTMAAPSCFVITFRRNLENELPADTEQCPPRALALGLDHSDFLAAMAPKPIIILGKEKDYFDARGLEEAHSRLSRLYNLLGFEENIGHFIGPGYHGYSRESREAMYRLFNRTTGISDLQSEPELVIEKDQTLYCAPRGQVCELDSRPIYSFTKAASQALAKKRRSNLSAPALKRLIVRALRLRDWAKQETPEYRILRNWRSRRYPMRYWTTYTIDTEPGILAVVYRLSDERLMSRPPKGNKRAILYVSHQSSDAELRAEPLVRELLEAEPGSAFYTCDVRGIGESQPDTCNQNSFLDAYGSDYFYAIHSIMLNRPYVGQRTYDLLRVLDWLKSNGHEEVHLVAKGWGALPATFAAVLSDRVKQVTLKNALTSYTDIAESETYTWPLSALVPDILKSFDLPDCYRTLRNKKLKQIDPCGADASKIAMD